MTIPTTAVNINEIKNKSAKNGIRKMVKRKRRTKSEGRRTNQLNKEEMRSAKPFPSRKISCSHFPTNLVTADVSL